MKTEYSKITFIVISETEFILIVLLIIVSFSWEQL